jgi:hypothetical protein
MNDLISRKVLYEALRKTASKYELSNNDEWVNGIAMGLEFAKYLLEDAPAVNPLPCKIGDTVWTFRNYWGTPIIKSGVVSEMFYLDDMRLAIVVKNTARGFWGKDIFATYEEAEAAYRKRRG